MQRTSMKTAMVIGVFVYQMTSILISSISTSCLSFMETCMSESDFCEKTAFRNHCNHKDESCQITDPKVCNMTIQSILDQYPTVIGCLCTWEEPCTTLDVLALKCLTETGSQALSSSSRTPFKEPQVATRESCPSALHSCQKSHQCATAYKTLKDSCQIGKNKCDSPSSQDSCLSLWMELQSTSLSNCTCALSSRKCLGIWRSVNNNPCIQKALDRRESSNMRHKLPVNAQQKGLVVDWKGSSLKEYVHESGDSCLQQTTVCLHDEVCNRWLVPLVQACSSKRCNDTHCRQITQQFYAGLPFNVAQMFVLCECKPENQDCLQMKKSLHGGTCGELQEDARTPICLEVFHSCLTEAHCRNRLEALLSKCWDTEEIRCSDYAVDTCISSLDPAVILGRDPECQRALSATMGTVLQHPCTCEGLYNRDLYKCNRIHEVLHNRAYFMSPLKKASTPDVPSEMNEPHQGFEWLTDLLLSVFAYVLLVVVVLLAVMVAFYRWMHSKTENKCRPPDKNCVVIF
ncbi:hypothetical protein UPYG_G00327110 [Umbra pygmaea]|uniref:GDNF/GAS1 domain-containing protein n=1 Tax=Umbra pygmaea TaxID=75934 RepID=A0ABD0W643_UMBPY